MKKIFAILAVFPVSAATFGLAGTAGPASAAVQPAAAADGSTVTFTSHSKADRADDVIDCRAVLSNPHNSSHFRGRVNVKGVVTCTQRVTAIDLTAFLSYGKSLEGVGIHDGTGVSEWSVNAASVTCHTGIWAGEMLVDIVAPPGFFPPFTAATLHNTASVPKCPAK